MDKIFFNPKSNGFLHESITKLIPPDAVEISKEDYRFLRQGQLDGKTISSKDGLPILIEQNIEKLNTIEERSWRNSELIRSDVELYKVQDADNKAIGTVSQWRDYRKYLRAWPESKDFPNKKFRPVAPDA